MTIKVNSQEWNKLDADQQAQISGIIGQHFKGQTIEASDGAEAVAELTGPCEIACDVAQAAAIEACHELPWGEGICISLAKEAGKYCRQQC